jgi:hypothetical protein
MLGVQGLYNDGWMLSGVPIRPPWELATKAVENPATAFKFELYDVLHDWTQCNDVAATNPDKVKQLKNMMFGEFAKYQVFPLDASASPRFVAPRPSLSAGRTVFTYFGEPITGIPNGTQPSLLNTSYTITADVDVPEGSANGMIVNEGGRFGGYGMYLLNSKPVFTWNLLLLKRVRWEGPELSPGRHTIVFDFKYDGLGAATLAYNNLSGVGRGGIGNLSVDGNIVSTQKMDRTIPLAENLDSEFNIGSASANPLDDQDYQIPFAFNGKINKVTIEVSPPKLTPEDLERLEAANRAAQDAQ